MNITIYGSGYVGLVTGACFAQMGNKVLCVDIDADKTAALREGVIPIYEPGLEKLIEANVAAGRIDFTTDAKQGVHHGQIQFIAVGTPPDEDGSADLQHVLAVADTIGQYMDRELLVVDKSTVPVGTADLVKNKINQALEKRGLQIPFDVASNPEFLKEGNAIADFTKPDRIVIGADKQSSLDLLSQLYAPFNRNHDRIITMDTRSAELTKYAANSLLATKISFMNEIANIAERVGADVEKVRIGIGSDPRIGYHFIYPGCGYGGSCFPKDVQALQHTAEKSGVEAHIIRAVQTVNENQKLLFANKILTHFAHQLADKTFALWGLSFKPNTDDMREAPSRVVMQKLWEAGAKIQAYDPEAADEAARIFGERDDLVLYQSATDALANADALIVATEWNEFRSPDFDFIHETLKQPVIFDGRNLYDPDFLRQKGFVYYGIGRGHVKD